MLTSAHGFFDVSRIAGATGSMTSTALLPLAAVGQLNLNLGAGDDTTVWNVDSFFDTIAIVDSFFDVFVDGSTGDDDLRVTGVNPIENVNYAPGPEATGGRVRATHQEVTATIQFTGLEPVTVTVPSTLTVDGPATGNTIVVDESGGGSMTRIEFGGYEYLDYTNQSSVTLNLGGGNDQLSIRGDLVRDPYTVNGGGGDDEVTLALDEGDIVSPFTFNGGDQLSVRGDIMNLIARGRTLDLLTFDHTGPDSGSININDNDNATITFTGLEPVVVNAGSITNMVFNLPSERIKRC